MIPAPAVDGRRVESFFQELRRFAPHYTPDLNLSDEQGAGVALMRIFAQLAEIVAVRLDQAPQKHFVAFLDKLGITLLPARAARAAVTFRLASGFEEAVKVPSGTRVTAPGVEDEIPFETTGELVAIPGVLTAAYGINPLKDEIFSPPPGFLKQEPRTPTELTYEIQSFVPATSNRFQLNHTTELEPGSFVRIGCKEKRVIQKVDEGNFVTLYEPVEEDFADDTIVVPIRNFEVFDGIDRQEHILYIGHNSLFTVKEEVEITLEIELEDSQTPNLQPLDLVWQFWTKDEGVTPEQEEHWEPLTVKSDGTAGLASSGKVVLVKPAPLEIKPRKVGGRESRWIRAKLRDKLPVGRTLPEVETIEVGVNTKVNDKGEPIGILADQGFHNATPLDVQVAPGIGFFPFGTEPRQFDQFYIASKEAFSKREAKVNLEFDLELRTLAGASIVAIPAASLDLRAYSIGLGRRLYELDLKGRTFNLFGNPSENQASTYSPIKNSIPSAIFDSTIGILVFVNTEDKLAVQNAANKIWVHSHKSNETTGNWIDLDAPAKKRVSFNPSAVHTPGGAGWQHPSRVFVVDAEGKLYSRGYPGGTGWDAHGSPLLQSQTVELDSTPFAVVAGPKIFVFVNGGGTVHWLTLDSNLTAGGVWKSLKPNNQSFTAKYRPFAQTFVKSGVEHAKVFVFAFKTAADPTSGHLFECDTSTEDTTTHEFPWDDLGQPTAEAVTEDSSEAHAPNGFIQDPLKSLDKEGKHIFLRGADKRLYERLDSFTQLGKDRWEDRTRSGDSDLRDSPAVFPEPSGATNRLHVFAASGRNSIVRRVFEETSGTIVANSGAQAGRLGENLASSRNNDYRNKEFEIINGTGSGQTEDIIAYDGELRLVRLQSQLGTLPDDTSECTIDGANVGFARLGADRLFTMHPPSPLTDETSAKGLHIRIDDDYVPLDFYSRITGVVSLNPAAVTVAAPFAIYSELVLFPNEFQSPEDTGTFPELSWEYWNGSGWLSLRGVSDVTHNLLTNGGVKFEVPKDIESTEVAGQENYWIRARLVGGDYGRETFKIEGSPPNQTIVSDKSSLRPPKVRELRISYKAKPALPETCLTFNNLDYLDQTAACQTPDSHFPPFETLEDTSFTIFLGFDKTFKTGPVQLLLDAAERNYDETKPPELAWSFRKDRKWKNLDAEDGSVALTRQGILTVSASEELTRESRFGESLYWIKGSLRLDRALAEAETDSAKNKALVETTDHSQKSCTDETDQTVAPCSGSKHEVECTCAGSKHKAQCNCADSKDDAECTCDESKDEAENPCAEVKDTTQASNAIAAASADYPLPLLRGVFLNTVYAIHGETITEEIVGSGDGEQNQTHAMQHDNVLQGEDIRIQEPLSAEERERIERELGKDSVVDREDLGGTWVRWKEVKALFDCGPQDRCYEIDRAAGILRFGDGLHGSIVPAGVDNIRAFSYRTGGGSVGNVETNKIEALATAVAGIESVFNPAPAGGGSDKADTDEMLTIGPRRISHGDRAVSVADFEELAYEASRQVAKVRCLGTTNLVLTGTGLPDPCDPRQLHQALEERGCVSLIIVPDSPDPRPCPSLELRRAVKEYLRDRAPSVVAVGERIVVRPPDYVTVGIQANIFVTTLEKAAAAETQARTKLEKFLHPVRGGPEGNGWEFGRPITRSDIFALLERITDIDRVEDLVFQFDGRKDPNRVDIGPNELVASGEHKLAIKKS